MCRSRSARDAEFSARRRRGAASAACSQRCAEAANALSCLSRIDPKLRGANLPAWLSFLRPEDALRWAEGLRKAGLPG